MLQKAPHYIVGSYFVSAEVQGQAIQEVLGSSSCLQLCKSSTAYVWQDAAEISYGGAAKLLLYGFCYNIAQTISFFLIEHFAMETTEMKFWAVKSVKQQNYYNLQNYLSVLISQLPSNAKLTYLNSSSLYITENNIYIYLHRHLYIKLRKNHYLSK